MLLVTVFGDAVRPHRQAVWLGSLTELLEPLGINDRLVRTSLRRLVGEGLVLGEGHGRRSFYRVHPDAEATFARAETRIYRARHPKWDGEWTVAVIDPSRATPDQRRAIRRQLTWAGMGQVTPTVFVSPTVAVADVEAASEGLPAAPIIITRGPFAAGQSQTPRQLAERIAPLDELHAACTTLIKRFGPLADALAGDDPTVEPADAFLARTLLVNEHRRIALRAVALPVELHSDDWIGERAFELVGSIYRALRQPSDRRLVDVWEGAEPLQPVAGEYRRRFDA
jgi:phenylacetic acid degradation operon negative regulatory protein